MKKILLFILCVIGCHAVELRVTKIISDLNLYIFQNKYVVKVSNKIPTVVEGSKLDLDIDIFYEADQWIQEIEITQKRKIGTTHESGTDSNKHWLDEVLDEDNSNLDKRHYSKTQDHYAYETTLQTFTFKPLGIINKKPLDLESFSYFAQSRTAVQPLRSYTSLYTDSGWFWNDKNIDRENFPGEETQLMVTIDYLVDVYRSLPAGFTHEIYPIFDRNEPHLLSGVLNCCYKRKLFLYDYINGLAMFEYK